MTLEELVTGLRDQGPTMDVPTAARVIGVSRATLYTAIQAGQSPVRTIKVLSRVKVLTESVVALLEGRPDVISGETASETRRSEGTAAAGTRSGVKRAPSDGSRVA